MDLATVTEAVTDAVGEEFESTLSAVLTTAAELTTAVDPTSLPSLICGTFGDCWSCSSSRGCAWCYTSGFCSESVNANSVCGFGNWGTTNYLCNEFAYVWYYQWWAKWCVFPLLAALGLAAVAAIIIFCCCATPKSRPPRRPYPPQMTGAAVRPNSPPPPAPQSPVVIVPVMYSPPQQAAAPPPHLPPPTALELEGGGEGASPLQQRQKVDEPQMVIGDSEVLRQTAASPRIAAQPPPENALQTALEAERRQRNALEDRVAWLDAALRTQEAAANPSAKRPDDFRPID